LALGDRVTRSYKRLKDRQSAIPYTSKRTESPQSDTPRQNLSCIEQLINTKLPRPSLEGWPPQRVKTFLALNHFRCSCHTIYREIQHLSVRLSQEKSRNNAKQLYSHIYYGVGFVAGLFEIGKMAKSFSISIRYRL
jgi:hypothetical protein